MSSWRYLLWLRLTHATPGVGEFGMLEVLPSHVGIVDGVLPVALAEALLDYAIASELDFRPATVGHYREEHAVAAEQRNALRCKTGLGPLDSAFRAAMLANFDDLLARTGVAAFTPDDLEIELVAHRDGCFFGEHIDTYTGSPDRCGSFIRVLSSVVYLFREPKRFSGGEISFRSLAGDEEWQAEPQHNRLVAFASFDPHEVLPVSVPGDAFADARFSVNCWFARADARHGSQSAFSF